MRHAMLFSLHESELRLRYIVKNSRLSYISESELSTVNTNHRRSNQRFTMVFLRTEQRVSNNFELCVVVVVPVSDQEF